jgi:hypothetical protein
MKVGKKEVYFFIMEHIENPFLLKIPFFIAEIDSTFLLPLEQLRSFSFIEEAHAIMGPPHTCGALTLPAGACRVTTFPDNVLI